MPTETNEIYLQPLEPNSSKLALNIAPNFGS